jgi:VanZ family protein
MRASIHGLRIAVIALTAYWLLLFISTHIPIHHLMAKIGTSDKVIHAVAFAGLAFLMAWAIPTNLLFVSRNVLLAGVVGVVYAGVDELLQIPVGRTADWMDFQADCIGISIGLAIYTAIRDFLLRRKIQILEEESKPPA